MQTAPSGWEALWAQDAEVELRAEIGGIAYGPRQIISCSAHPAAFSGLAIGQAVSAELDISFVPLGNVPRAAEIKLFCRLTNGTVSTAWVPQGTYYADTREADRELDVLTLTAFDRMMFAEELYFSSGSITGVWPRPAPQVVNEVCQRLGISLDSRTSIDSALMVAMPVNLTMRDVLRNIAAAHGGNFIISPAGRLRLLPLENLPDITLLGNESGDFVADEYGNRILIIEGAYADAPCEEAKTTGVPVEITQVVLTLDDEHAYIAGDDTGYTLTALCLYADQPTANRALTRVQGVRYEPGEASGAVFDPLLELGDTVYSSGSMFRLYRIDIEYDSLCVADLSAPIDGDVEHEIPYQSSTERLVNWKIAQTRAAITMDLDNIRLEVSNELDGLSSSIDIKLDGITSRVVGAEGHISTLTQTANSLQSQITDSKGSISSINQTVNSITTEISYMDRDISRIEQKVDNIRLEVSNGEASSWISLEVNGIEVSSRRIQFTGDVVFESDLRSGYTLISGDCIRTGVVTASNIRLGGEMNIWQSLDDNADFGGSFGFLNGHTADGSITQGLGMMFSSWTGQMMCSSNGARMGYGNGSSVTCTNNKVSLTAWNEVVVNGTLRSSDGTVITSDRDKKEDIRDDLERYLDLFDRLQPVSYRLKGRNRRHLGLIAQDVELALDEARLQSWEFAAFVADDESGYGLRYEEFIPLLVKKIQQLESKIKELCV